jgi:hypothetical protein
VLDRASVPNVSTIRTRSNNRDVAPMITNKGTIAAFQYKLSDYSINLMLSLDKTLVRELCACHCEKCLSSCGVPKEFINAPRFPVSITTALFRAVAGLSVLLITRT